jgi:molybdate transport system ATP-binding protein
VTVVFGASGAGKSTLLDLICGNLKPDRGLIRIGERVFVDTNRNVDLTTEQRAVGWVPQDGLLFPHLDVTANLEFGARRARRRLDRPVEIDRRQVIDTLGLGKLLQRWPRTLSGGERQRVALGRALLSNPSLLLLDEPLAALDAPRKAEILALLELIKHQFSIPAIYVTHSLAEVLRLADHLVLLDAGRVAASDRIDSLMGRAHTPLLSMRADTGSLLTLRVSGRDPAGDGWLTTLEDQTVRIPLLPLAVGVTTRAYVPANEVIIATQAPQGLSVRNALRATILCLRDRGDGSVLVELAVGAQRLLAAVTPAAVKALALAPEQSVYALVKSVSLDAPAGGRLLEMG